MKNVFLLLLVVSYSVVFAQNKTENVIIVTYDGYRWQELFTGAEKRLMEDPDFVTDIPSLKAKYWDESPERRREKITPFIWNTVARQGVIIGNRKLGSKMNVKNMYLFSYPGYNEMFTGRASIKINSNEYPDNPNLTIFDLLQQQPAFKDKTAAFATWDAFPRIINSKRNGVPVYVNYNMGNNGVISCNGHTCQAYDPEVPASNYYGKTDTITYRFAKEYLKKNHPRMAFIGFDETDDYAHGGKYDAYLNTASMLDRYMADLWKFIQSDPQYKDKTTLIITCDHGRGSMLKSSWRHHNVLQPRSRGIWMAVMGPDTPAKGELKKQKKVFQKQISPTIAELLGLKFFKGGRMGKPIELVTGKEKKKGG